MVWSTLGGIQVHQKLEFPTMKSHKCACRNQSHGEIAATSILNLQLAGKSQTLLHWNFAPSLTLSRSSSSATLSLCATLSLQPFQSLCLSVPEEGRDGGLFWEGGWTEECRGQVGAGRREGRREVMGGGQVMGSRSGGADRPLGASTSSACESKRRVVS
eukprot:1882519-Rhodomonas_salina.1